jgi:hypothetical protein
LESLGLSGIGDAPSLSPSPTRPKRRETPIAVGSLAVLTNVPRWVVVSGRLADGIRTVIAVCGIFRILEATWAALLLPDCLTLQSKLSFAIISRCGQLGEQ